MVWNKKPDINLTWEWPGGMELRGEITSGETELAGKIITVVLPKEEVEDTEKGDMWSLGMIADEICIEARNAVG